MDNGVAVKYADEDERIRIGTGLRTVARFEHPPGLFFLYDYQSLVTLAVLLGTIVWLIRYVFGVVGGSSSSAGSGIASLNKKKRGGESLSKAGSLTDVAGGETSRPAVPPGQLDLDWIPAQNLKSAAGGKKKKSVSNK